MSFTHPCEKLRRLSAHSRQLWVVIHVDASRGQSRERILSNALEDSTAAFDGGADGAVLINQKASHADLEASLAAVRNRYPRMNLGVNYLGDESEPYGYGGSFRLAREYGLQMVWTDFSGVDLIQEQPPADLHAIQAARPSDVFYCSGIHMKYSTLRDPSKTIEESALQAMGWLDGVIVTGPATGVACDPVIARRAREVLGRYPLGVASGVSVENVDLLLPFVDFYLVASSLEDSGTKRTIQARVEALARRIHS